MTHMTNQTNKRPERRAFTLLELVIVLGIILLLLGLVLGVGSIVVRQSEQRQLTASMSVIDAALQEFEAQTGRPIVFQGHYSPARWYHCGWRNGTSNDEVYYDVPFSPFNDTRFTTGVSDGGYGWQPICEPWQTSNSQTIVELQWLAATLAVLEQNPICAEMIAKTDPHLLSAAVCITGAGGGPNVRALNIKQFVDPWGIQVVIVFPGRLYDDGDNSTESIIRDKDGTVRTPVEKKYGICRNRRPILVSAGPDVMLGNLGSPTDSDNFADALDNIYSYVPEQP